jgi:hypothetical protein
MNQRKPAQKDNLKMVVIFLIGVFALLFLSLLFKLVTVVARSSFDGRHNFTVSFLSKDLPQKSILVTYAPDKETISILQVFGDINHEKVAKTLQVPVDGYVNGAITVPFIKSSENQGDMVVDLTSQLLISYPGLKTNLTIIDVFRLFLFATSVQKHNILERSLSLPMDDPSMDKISSFIVVDQTVAEEKESIAIVNGTSVGGLGARLGRLLNNMGGNVVSVSSSDTTIETSKVAYYKEASYTAKRIGKILSFPLVEANQQGIADVTIYIGNDKEQSLVF